MKMLKLILAGFVAACSFNFQEQGNKASPSFKIPDVGVISLLNARGKKIDENCMTEIVKKLITLCDENKLEPVRTEIWKDHTIVKEALSELTIKIERESAGKYFNILIPIKHKGNRIILYKEDKDNSSYALYSLPENPPDIDFSKCIR
ncbi:MAG: hypothetical protein A3C43_06880 [Candidatus Schekmanbacteria bacterium RIFCSPHIGHO2_02_FULL_38_11]|uniref:Uncharacterized protein n=1 Tax=Candidatus Schekmanbacteria bacterium RIFCSPLOWO2_12_FULL_38_15 TaxID=1817883 RepID=A0A1F7SFF1_9BACT|nr:MAG: hypothetical protein A3G31_11025 [Candidatus Schekmanbacteria bacterium RIFCSPLOWO2_12_FULL_38_15]OGL55551.1 MAG: hypothetical protein A3C43_06880 [Candidatus Schekmanbacteria bacterium RIFCSPHIGHO2_02_FULL_38_11]